MTILQSSFLIISAIFGTLALAIFLWARSRQQPSYSTEIRKITLAETWDLWRESQTLEQEEAAERDRLLSIIDAEDLAAIHNDLVHLDREEFSGIYPLTKLREEIMASVDRRSLNDELLKLPAEILQKLRDTNPEILQRDSDVKRYLLANELRLLVLREYTKLRFGDCTDADWFAVYLRASRIKQRTLHSMIENSMQEDVTDGTVRLQAIQLVDEKLREKLLRVPPGTTFEGLPD